MMADTPLVFTVVRDPSPGSKGYTVMLMGDYTNEEAVTLTNLLNDTCLSVAVTSDEGMMVDKAKKRPELVITAAGHGDYGRYWLNIEEDGKPIEIVRGLYVSFRISGKAVKGRKNALIVVITEGCLVRPGVVCIPGHDIDDQYKYVLAAYDTLDYSSDLVPREYNVESLKMFSSGELKEENTLNDDAMAAPQFDPEKMYFSEVLIKLRCGQKLTRKGWSGESLYVTMMPGYPAGIVANVATVNALRPSTTEEPRVVVSPYLVLVKDRNIPTISTWVPSSGDLFADDWKLYNIYDADEDEN